MDGKHVKRRRGPYSYDAWQEPGTGTWTVRVTRSSGQIHSEKYQSETHTYTCARLPSHPEAAWRAVGVPGGSVAAQVTRTGLRGIRRLILWAILIFLILIIVLFFVAFFHDLSS
jgi:hypothetical protein